MASLPLPSRQVSSEGGTVESSSSSSRRWTLAIQRIVLEKVRATSSPARNNKPDLVGEHLTNLINRSPAFTTPRGNNDGYASAQNNLDLQWTKPLLCRHNLQVLRHYTRRRVLRPNSFGLPQQQQQQHPRVLGPAAHDPATSQRLPTLRSALVLLARLLALGMAVSALLGTSILVWTARTAFWWTSLLLGYILDCTQVYRTVVPSWFRDGLQVTWFWMDNHIGLARRFAGREWTSADFVWEPAYESLIPIMRHDHVVDDNDTGSSGDKTLWELPPPTLKQLGRRLSLDADYVWKWVNNNQAGAAEAADTNKNLSSSSNSKPGFCRRRPQWSRETAQHVTAMHFCYAMLRDDQLRRQAARQRNNNNSVMFNKSSHSTSSSHFLLHHQEDSRLRLDEEREQEERPPASKAAPRRSQSASAVLLHLSSSGSQPPEQEAIEVRALPSSSNASSSSSSLPLLPLQQHESALSLLPDDNDDMSSSAGPRHLSSSDLWEVSSVVTSSSASSGNHMDGDVDPDLPWIDVGHKIGMRFLNSAHVQRAMTSQETTDRLLMMGKFGGGGSEVGAQVVQVTRHESVVKNKQQQPTLLLSKPIHSMRTTPWAPTTASVPQLRRLPSAQVRHQRQPLASGVKVAVPLFPLHPGCGNQNDNMAHRRRHHHHAVEMGTVVSSRRIYVGDTPSQAAAETNNNCLSVTVKLDRCFLRNGEFSELTFRVMDEWEDRYMPRHSKFAVGACVATWFGIGVLVSWRAEDDCHVVRSLWQRQGPGSAHAYLNRDAIRGVVEAAIGFQVQTRFGAGVVVTCANACQEDLEFLRYFVAIKEPGRHKGHVLELERRDIVSCHAQFRPIIEFIREAAHFQIQVDQYEAALREQTLDDDQRQEDKEEITFWTSSSECLDILWSSFLKAVDEDREFDEGVNEFMAEIIQFLEELDQPTEGKTDEANKVQGAEIEIGSDAEGQDPGFWIMDELFGGIFKEANKDEEILPSYCSPSAEDYTDLRKENFSVRYYARAFGILKVLMKTVSIARAASGEYPHFHLSLAVLYEFLLFTRTVVRVQQKNSSVHAVGVSES